MTELEQIAKACFEAYQARNAFKDDREAWDKINDFQRGTATAMARAALKTFQKVWVEERGFFAMEYFIEEVLAERDGK